MLLKCRKIERDILLTENKNLIQFSLMILFSSKIPTLWFLFTQKITYFSERKTWYAKGGSLTAPEMHPHTSQWNETSIFMIFMLKGWLHHIATYAIVTTDNHNWSPSIFNIIAGSLGCWEDRLIDQVSHVSSIFVFFIISWKFLFKKSFQFIFLFSLLVYRNKN